MRQDKMNNNKLLQLFPISGTSSISEMVFATFVCSFVWKYYLERLFGAVVCGIAIKIESNRNGGYHEMRVKSSTAVEM